ncbi:MAG: tail fiber protein [Clostridiales bacterium]|nr:tail fiber protein [Clostridiales bacterium]
MFFIGEKHGGDGKTTFAVPNKPGYCICVNGIYPSRGG